MFTGIVETVGTVLSRRPDRIAVAPGRPFGPVALGESICVDGVCLTVDRLRPEEASPGASAHRRRGAGLEFRLLPETLRVSTLGELREGGRVNLERAVRLGSRLGGHLLLGHVDARGTVTGRARAGRALTLEIQVPEGLATLLVPKGPIAVDGVSLTLDARVRRDRIRVHLISHTLKSTTLGRKAEGSRVNLEADLVAKYLRGMLS